MTCIPGLRIAQETASQAALRKAMPDGVQLREVITGGPPSFSILGQGGPAPLVEHLAWP